ncbi:hypothetical protein [Exiguobacterium sp. s131]|uniref:hypothetical protein n=1 Tax=Exiguobacterium sp. s131 TaxID=2751278 RepID=UPI001BE84FF4|nr:hypothetical protein [Exiguobacterium sp. s131]
MINKELLEQFGSEMKKMQDTFLKIAEAQQRQVNEAQKSIQYFLNQIDFELLEQTFVESYEVLGKQAETGAKENLFLNMDMLDEMTLAEMPHVLNSKWMMRWMEIHFEKKIAALASDDSCFGDTTILLRQSYNAYTREDYALSFISLYPVIDSFVSHWYTSIDGEVKISPDKRIKSLEKTDKDDIKKKHKKIKETLDSGERSAIEFLFISYALHAYALMNSNKGHYGFKRHHALHGSLEYGQIQQQDCIKLFFCLYSLYCSRHISKSKYMGFDEK